MGLKMEQLIEKKINEYTEKYATKHHITIEEAREHLMVKIARHYFEGANYDKNR